MSRASDSGSKGSGAMKHYAEKFMFDFDLSERVKEILAAQPLNTVNPTSFHVNASGNHSNLTREENVYNALGNPRVGQEDTCDVRTINSAAQPARTLQGEKDVDVDVDIFTPAQAMLVSEATNNTVVDSNVRRR